MWLFYKPQLRDLFWYEDNNLGKNGGYPTDFLTKFTTQEWQACSEKIDVYQIGLVTLRQFPETFLTEIFLPYLKKHRLALALDVEGATWLHLNPGREALFETERVQIHRLSQLQAPVKYVTLQSVLCKDTLTGEDYSLAHRIQDIKTYKAMVRRYFPEARVGIIDALPSHGKDWKMLYSKLCSTVTARFGNAVFVPIIDYVHLDAPYRGYIQSAWDVLTWYDINRIRKFLNSRQIKFGLLLTSESGKVSSQAFTDDVVQMHHDICKYLGSAVEEVLISWFAYPEVTVPTISTLINQVSTLSRG